MMAILLGLQPPPPPPPKAPRRVHLLHDRVVLPEPAAGPSLTEQRLDEERQTVLAHVRRHGPCRAAEAADALDMTEYAATARLGELLCTGHVRRSKSGRVVRWEALP